LRLPSANWSPDSPPIAGAALHRRGFTVHLA
jgi:hypothetical protein